MENNNYKVFAKTKNNLVINIYSTCFKQPSDKDFLIKEGSGDEFVHVGYYEVVDKNNCYNYKIENNKLVKRTSREKENELNNIKLIKLKNEKILQSKEMLETWLYKHPMYSEIHNSKGEYYNVTKEKQMQLTQLLELYSIVKQTGEELELTWNSTGGICEKWTYDELTALSFQILEYVLPRVKKQQTIEVTINNSSTIEEVESIEIQYDTI